MNFGKIEFKYILFFAIFVFLAFIFVIISCVFLFFVFSKSSDKGSHETYPLSRLNPSTNKSSIGFAKIGRVLSEEEYLTFNNPKTGETSIITNFFDSEFECTGSCYCGDYNKAENRRIGGSIVNNGLFLLFSAVSVSMAVNIAAEVFQNNCENSMVGVCANIKSEVDDCKEAPSPKEFVFEGEEEDGRELRTYACYGHCVDNEENTWQQERSNIDDFRQGPNIREARQAFGDCSKLELTEDVEIIVPINKKRGHHSNQYAKNVFLSQHLVKFCRSQSKVKVEASKSFGNQERDASYISKKESKKKFTIYFREIETSACVAKKKGHGYSNLRCRLIRKEILL